MIEAEVRIPDRDWTVALFCAVTCYDTDEILASLLSIGCPDRYLMKAEALMDTCRMNTGLTFSNPSLRKSVVVTALSSSSSQFLNSMQHEIRHLADDIISVDGIRDGEDAAYLTGDINSAVFPYVAPLLCEHCRSVRLLGKK